MPWALEVRGETTESIFEITDLTLDVLVGNTNVSS